MKNLKNFSSVAFISDIINYFQFFIRKNNCTIESIDRIKDEIVFCEEKNGNFHVGRTGRRARKRNKSLFGNLFWFKNVSFAYSSQPTATKQTN